MRVNKDRKQACQTTYLLLRKTSRTLTDKGSVTSTVRWNSAVMTLGTPSIGSSYDKDASNG
jgi:hypothetical protein